MLYQSECVDLVDLHRHDLDLDLRERHIEIGSDEGDRLVLDRADPAGLRARVNAGNLDHPPAAVAVDIDVVFHALHPSPDQVRARRTRSPPSDREVRHATAATSRVTSTSSVAWFSERSSADMGPCAR